MKRNDHRMKLCVKDEKTKSKEVERRSQQAMIRKKIFKYMRNKVLAGETAPLMKDCKGNLLSREADIT